MEKKSDFIYLRIDRKHKKVEFYETWEQVSNKSGKKKKYRKNQRRAIINEIREAMGGFPTKHEVNQWELPEWIKSWIEKTMKEEIYITRYNNIIYYRFKNDVGIQTIEKHHSFEEFYSYEYYIYDLLMKICQYSDMQTLYVKTDIAELFRINRIYYDKSSKNRLIFTLETYETISQMMGGRRHG